MGLIGGIWIL